MAINMPAIADPLKSEAYERERKKVEEEKAEEKKEEEKQEKPQQKITGAECGGILDKSEIEQSRFAESYYLEIKNRKSKSDIKRIAKNTGISEEDVKIARCHLFETEKHLMADGSYRKFDKSPEIALAWQRLEQNNFSEVDVILLNHEVTEAKIMADTNCCYEKAHWQSNLQYPWQFKKDERWRQKSDDEIQQVVREQLKNYL